MNSLEDIDKIESAINELKRSSSKHDFWESMAREIGTNIDHSGALFLQILAHEEKPRLLDLAKRLGIEAPSVTRKVQQLEELGYVVRTSDPEDKRASRLALTAEGQKVVTRTMEVKRKHLSALVADWPPEDLHQFARLIDKLAHSAQNLDLSQSQKKKGI